MKNGVKMTTLINSIHKDKVSDYSRLKKPVKCRKWLSLGYDNDYDAPIIKCLHCPKTLFPHFVHKTDDRYPCDYCCLHCDQDGYIAYFCYTCRHTYMDDS
jgi:hypothetical protein